MFNCVLRVFTLNAIRLHRVHLNFNVKQLTRSNYIFHKSLNNTLVLQDLC